MVVLSLQLKKTYPLRNFLNILHVSIRVNTWTFCWVYFIYMCTKNTNKIIFYNPAHCEGLRYRKSIRKFTFLELHFRFIHHFVYNFFKIIALRKKAVNELTNMINIIYYTDAISLCPKSSFGVESPLLQQSVLSSPLNLTS